MIKFYTMNFSGHNDWSGCFPIYQMGNLVTYFSIANGETNDNLDLFVVPQYGRNPDYTG